MDEWQNTPIAMPPMSDEDGEEYARQETLDGKDREHDPEFRFSHQGQVLVAR
jgi:hypothetical protein